jgi:hypothetical protein
VRHSIGVRAARHVSELTLDKPLACLLVDFALGFVVLTQAGRPSDAQQSAPSQSLAET